MSNIKSMKKADLIALAGMQNLTLTGKETREDLIAMLSGKEVPVTDTLDNLIDEGGNTMANSNPATTNEYFCPECLKRAELTLEQAIALSEEDRRKKGIRPLTITVMDFCKKTYVGKPVLCFSHQKLYKAEIRRNAEFEKNMNAGNVCYICNNTLTDQEVLWCKDHAHEWSEELQDKLLCKSCQPGTTGYKNVQQAKEDEQQCYVCGSALSEDEKACGYWHHNKYCAGMTDKCLCFAHMPKNVVKLYKGIKIEKVNKVAEEPATYNAAPSCTCDQCGCSLTSKAVELSARLSLVPGFAGMHLCVKCQAEMGVLSITNK